MRPLLEEPWRRWVDILYNYLVLVNMVCWKFPAKSLILRMRTSIVNRVSRIRNISDFPSLYKEYFQWQIRIWQMIKQLIHILWLCDMLKQFYIACESLKKQKYSIEYKLFINESFTQRDLSHCGLFFCTISRRAVINNYIW